MGKAKNRLARRFRGNFLARTAFNLYAGMLMEAAPFADLIRRAQRREEDAFDELVERYSKRLYEYFYRLTGSRTDAEDLLQELFVRLVRMIGSYKHDGRFDGWVFRIATNLVRDRVRRVRKAKGAGLEVGPGSGSEESDPLGGIEDPRAVRPDGQLDQSEQVERLQWAMDQLSEPEREVILLRHFSQMSFRQIAETMDTPLGTALARAHRGLARLRALMADEEPEG